MKLHRKKFRHNGVHALNWQQVPANIFVHGKNPYLDLSL